MAGAVYWVGSDNNVYLKSGSGVQNVGSANQFYLTPNGIGNKTPFAKFNAVATQISDPNPPQQNLVNNTVGDTSGGGGGYAAVAPVGPSHAQVDPILASLATLDSVLGNKNAQSQAEHDRAVSSYDAQDAIDHEAYDKNVHNNEQSYTAGNQAALLNAANASTGLRGVLASFGALAGSGKDIVRKLVGLAANSDLGGAKQNFTTNADSLTHSFAQTTQQEKQRRDDAEAILHNNMQNNEANVLTSKQSIYQQLANLYGSGTAEGNDYASKATSLAAPIAATTHASVAPYAAPSSLFSPAALSTYLAGTKNLNVSTSAPAPDSTPVNSPLYTPVGTKKDQLVGVA